ncbi:hypothetical protein BC936DRAFT_146571 [Jimgerdemannia flammicorona]|uniref:Uncharacterized protein n=1 Tax=Jimgerdemannia flammicorona TaxID=994334 RepID=A0A433DLH6_9FUNG|nr:hypothetical protein BC936DRAFT_146571 [Jimgerdemannia flammicorona]
MPTPTLPFDILTSIFKVFYQWSMHSTIENHIFHTDLFNCSLVSHDWRAAALPLLWMTLKIYQFIDKGWQRLADSLVAECASTIQGKINRASYITNIKMYTYQNLRSDSYAPIIRILNLLQASQLRNIEVETPLPDNILQTIFPALSHSLESLSFVDSNKQFRTCTPYSDIVLQNFPKSLRKLKYFASDRTVQFKKHFCTAETAYTLSFKP